LGAPAALGGGAWVPDGGDGDIQFGYSRKRADESWNPDGETRHSSSWHLFRYGYVGGEVGLGTGFSFRYTVLYLDGLEGPEGDMEHNAGMSETFLGVKRRLHGGKWPMALAFNLRTSLLYDLPGPYDRHLFLPDEDDVDGDGDDTEAVFKGVSSEWRGLLGEDYGLSFLVSRSVFKGGWANAELGYAYRTGNYADEVPLLLELGYRTGYRPLVVKGTFNWVQSLHNDSGRQPDDRFGCSANNCFPDASRMVLGASVFADLGAQKRWWGELGWNRWVWGESTRKYDEPFISVGRRF
jgi:hypothetical protein